VLEDDALEGRKPRRIEVLDDLDDRGRVMTRLAPLWWRIDATKSSR
jgi:hypothetical protein